MPFKIVTIGLKSAVAYIAQLQTVMAAVNYQDLAKIQEIGEMNILKHFKDQNFKPLAPSTIKRRIQNARAKKPRRDIGKPSDPILIVSKDLMLGTKSYATTKSVFWQNNRKHFGRHNFGYGFTPQREFFYFDASAITAMVAVPLARLKAAANKKIAPSTP